MDDIRFNVTSYLLQIRRSVKALRHGSHSVTYDYTNACFYLVNIHQTEVADI